MRLLRNYKLRLMYVQDRDLRADSLINSRGNVNPKSNAILQALIRSYHPTAYIDIGANYGEMIFSISKINKIQVYAFEPHPYIYNCLKSSIELTNIRASIFNLAIGKESKTITLIQKDAWSGTTRVDNQLSSNESYENIFSVKLTSLDEIFIGKNLNNFKMYTYSKNLNKLYEIHTYYSLQSIQHKIYGQDAILTLIPISLVSRVKLILWAKYELLAYAILFKIAKQVSKLKRVTSG